MGSLSRKLKREKMKEARKELKNKMMMFDSLPDACSFCKAPFDKKDRDHAMTWRVSVRKDKVLLYCPECMNLAGQVAAAAQASSQKNKKTREDYVEEPAESEEPGSE
jgi:hypothetical protein